MGEPFNNFIDGRWVESAGKATFDDINPANKTDVIGSFPRSDHRDIDRAVETARAHFQAWSRVPPPRRAEILYRAASLVEERSDELTAVLVRETGKLAREAQAESREGASVLRAIGAEVACLGGPMVPSGRPGALAMVTQLPLGVAAVITHWTFPLAGPLAALASALAAGNTVVLKPAEDAPLAGTRLVEMFLEVGLPPGAVSVVHGYGEEAGAPLVRHPDVVAVSFEGSSDVGREVAIACAAEQKRLDAHLGERCVLLVLEDADLDPAVEGAVRGAFALAGQRWRGATRALVHRKIAKEFAERVIASVQALRPGDGGLATTDIGPVISESQLKRVHAHTRVGSREGAKLLCGGEVVREGDCKRGFFYAPTVFGDATLKMRFVQDEVLGPALAVMSVGSTDEAVQQANAARRAATVAVFTRDLTRALRVAEGLRAGRVQVNPSLAADDAPSSLAGYGRLPRFRLDTGGWTLDRFSAWKEVTIEAIGGR
jgi:aldehyde dehydrogenase (NAD+)